MKTCKECKQLKSLIDFYKASAALDGHQSTCKTCRKKYDKLRYEIGKLPDEKAKYFNQPKPLKICAICGEKKEKSQLAKRDAAKDGLFYYCKECKSACHFQKKQNHPSPRGSQQDNRRRYEMAVARTKIVVPEMKICSQCGENKKAKQFAKSKVVSSGLAPICKVCFKARYEDRPYYSKEKSKKYNEGKGRERKLMREFGITVEQYDAMLIAQNHSCAICTRSQAIFKKRFAVDHCHETGQIRRLLCQTCNTGLGAFRDNPTLLEDAAAYLRRYKL